MYIPGEIIDLSELVDLNECLESEGLRPAKAENIVTGITNVSVSRSNFLSAASFQNTTSVLIRAAVSGAVDTLDGVKENVIIGRLVPIGSGHEGSEKQVMVKDVQDRVARELVEKEEMTPHNVSNDRGSDTTKCKRLRTLLMSLMSLGSTLPDTGWEAAEGVVAVY